MRRYDLKSVWVSTLCNVSSSGHYHWNVAYEDTTGKRYQRVYGFNLVNPLDVRVPQYLLDEIEKQIVINLETGVTKFFEYNQWGHRRFENLRYHEAERLPFMIKCLKGEV
jgi:hypothetical protein